MCHKPFVDWIWGDAVLMALGGCCSPWPDRRYRTIAVKTLEGTGRRQRPTCNRPLGRPRHERRASSFPLALFLGLAVLLGVGLTLKPRVPSRVRGKPAPAFTAAAEAGQADFSPAQMKARCGC